MTDSNHAPFSERERLAGIIYVAYWANTHSPDPNVPLLAAADAILADPAYARAAEIREALGELVEMVDAACVGGGYVSYLRLIKAGDRARALLDGDES